MKRGSIHMKSEKCILNQRDISQPRDMKILNRYKNCQEYGERGNPIHWQ